MNCYFFAREANGDKPGGITVSKTESLPDGDFDLTEYNWPDVTLWFIDDHDFTADEREACRLSWLTATPVERVKSDDPLPPPGTEVEIVYREPEIEIQAGQRWRITHIGECGAVCRVQISGEKWQIANENHVVCSIHDPFDEIRCYEKAELQSWLNEHATLEEGES